MAQLHHIATTPLRLRIKRKRIVPNSDAYATSLLSELRVLLVFDDMNQSETRATPDDQHIKKNTHTNHVLQLNACFDWLNTFSKIMVGT